MKSAIERMHDNAMRNSRKATRLLRQAAAAHHSEKESGPLSYESVLKVVELNRKAIEACKESTRTMDFLLRYRNRGQHWSEMIKCAKEPPPCPPLERVQVKPAAEP